MVKHLMRPSMEDMKKAISDAGGLFYQYRPCRRTAATIYDIENIRHGVVYAQTPLNMNDPFDSMIGFSAEKIYVNCISMLVDALPMDNFVKVIVSTILEYRALGKIAELMVLLKDLKKYLSSKRSSMHKTYLSLDNFVMQNVDVLFSKLPKTLKAHLSEESFKVFSAVISKLNTAEITESNIIDLMKMDNVLDSLHKSAEEIRDNRYFPALREFLSKLTISCFSVSGWDNQLMWSHYANSYAGICVEYDFTKINNFIGFIYPVAYSAIRPTLSLQDLGIEGLDVKNNELKQGEVDISSVIAYLLSKNICWSYEKEWRIFDVGEANTPKFINLPYVKSITFGLNIDPLCKRLLFDVCVEKGIACYEIVLNAENYSLDRKPLNNCDLAFDSDVEMGYINVLCQHSSDSVKKLEALAMRFSGNENSISKDFSYVRPMLEEAIDMISDAYFIKASLNRLCSNAYEGLSTFKMPESVLEAISQIDLFVATLAHSVEKIEENIPILNICGKINRVDYPVIQTQIHNLKELIDKFKLSSWHPICMKASDFTQAE